MTDADLARIEAALGVRLPAAYRELVCPFPIPALAGNADPGLWDDAAQLVELNRELRAGGRFVRPWPLEMLALGRDGSGSVHAIDLRDPVGPVWWADRGHLDVRDEGAPSLATWAGEYVADLRADLEDAGIDPDGSPESRKQVEDERARAGCRLMLILLGLGARIVLAVWGVALWLDS